VGIFSRGSVFCVKKENRKVLMQIEYELLGIVIRQIKFSWEQPFSNSWSINITVKLFCWGLFVLWLLIREISTIHSNNILEENAGSCFPALRLGCGTRLPARFVLLSPF